MAKQREFMRIAVSADRPIPYGDKEPDPIWHVVLAEYRAFLTGNKWVPTVMVATAPTEAEARAKGVEILRRWADQIERGE